MNGDDREWITKVDERLHILEFDIKNLQSGIEKLLTNDLPHMQSILQDCLDKGKFNRNLILGLYLFLVTIPFQIWGIILLVQGY